MKEQGILRVKGELESFDKQGKLEISFVVIARVMFDSLDDRGRALFSVCQLIWRAC